MNTKLLMISSALFLAIIGFTFSFLPNEIAEKLNIKATTLSILLLKILSALYLGFALINWMAKDAMIGGIYNRPIAIGNLMHFGVGAIALIKEFSNIEIHTTYFIVLTVIYVVFGGAFFYVFRSTPSTVAKS